MSEASLRPGDKVIIVSLAGAFSSKASQDKWGVGIGSVGEIVSVHQRPPFLGIIFKDANYNLELRLPVSCVHYLAENVTIVRVRV